MVRTKSKESPKAIKRVNDFFNRENVFKQLRTMVGFLIPHRKNVKLTLNIGGGSFTDGKSITVGLPEIFIDRSLEEIFSALRALVGHESQHINSSDFEAFVQFQKDIGNYFFKKYKIPQSYGMKVGKHLFNSVEDGRIEKILCNKLPGYTKHLKFLNGSFWEAQEIKGNSELEDFLYTITTFSVTGIYPKGFKNLYKGTALHENMKKIEGDIYSGIDAVTCKQCVGVCHDIILKVEDYLVQLLKERSQEDEEFLKNMPDKNEFTTSEETEKNGSGSGSTHFVPRKKEKEEEKEDQKEEQDGEGSDSGEEKEEDKKEEKGKGKGKGKKEEGNEEEGDDKGEEEGEESEEEGSGSNKSEDENSEDETEETSNGDSDESDEEGTEGDEESDKDSNSDSDKSDEESDEDSDANSDKDSDEEANDNDSSETDFEYPKGVDQNEDDDISEIDEDMIREQMKEITDDVVEEVKNRLKEDKPPKSKSSKKDEIEDITPEELREIENEYRNQTYKRFKEIKGFNSNFTLPVEIKSEGSKFRKEVEKIFRNKETYNLRSQKKGILDTGNLYKFAVKDFNMFMKRGTPVTTDYVAFILQDGSGSMTEDDKEFHSSKAMAVMEEGLKGIVPFKMSTFSVDWYSRAVVHYTAKDWNDNLSSINYSHNLHRSRTAEGGNKDGYSIRIATAELMRRPEKDRILIILSDGLPSDYDGGQREGMVDVKQAVKEARKKGIHVVSLIFGTEDFRDFNIDNYKFMYDKNIISCTPETITNNLVKMLKKIISR